MKKKSTKAAPTKSQEQERLDELDMNIQEATNRTNEALKRLQHRPVVQHKPLERVDNLLRELQTMGNIRKYGQPTLPEYVFRFRSDCCGILDYYMN